MFDMSLVDWSRAQFALTAMYHWLFVPFTLWVTYIIAIMNTIYYFKRTKFWEKTVRFWTRIFAVNFAIWVATWIILEFEFWTNWSNYSWFVWDIFWAPLMLEWITAFILEATFLAVILIWWWKVSKGFYLASAWIVAIWGSLSATWILVANAWMQNPIWMYFNPDTMRNEMLNFWEVFFNPVAIVKFSHTIASSFTLASVVVIWISSYYLLQNRQKVFAYTSIKLAAIFWFVWIFLTIITWDLSWEEVAYKQPMKLAAIEWHYYWEKSAWFNVVSWFDPRQENWLHEVKWSLTIPHALNLIVHKDTTTYIPSIDDLLYGNKNEWIVWAIDRIDNWKIAINALKDYKKYKTQWDLQKATEALILFRKHEKDFGYGYFDKNNLWELVPHVPILFYSFRYMVALGFFLFLFFIPAMYYLAKKKTLEKHTKMLKLALLMIPLTYIWSELWWVVAEVWRQPWVVNEVLPTKVWVSSVSTTTVMSTFFWFLIIFTILLIAALKIAIAEIKKGPGIWIKTK